jgi:hypothetical protein
MINCLAGYAKVLLNAFEKRNPCEKSKKYIFASL